MVQQQQQQQQIKKNQVKPPLYSNLIAGAIAGVIGSSVVFPLDFVKTRLQQQRVSIDGSKQYNGIIDCFKKVIKNEGGVRGLYRGLSSNLIGIIPEKALKLAMNDYFRTRFQGDRSYIKLWEEVASGGLAGMCQVVATNPMELVKIRMQVSGLSGKKASLKEVVSELGIKGLYKGTASTLLRDVPFSMIYFSIYGRMKHNLTDQETGEIGLPKILLCGITAGSIAASVSTPFDVIKTRIQVKPGPNDPHYKGIADCFRKTIQSEGPKALFKGVLPRVCIISPLFGITLVVYEIQKSFYASTH
ncbi:hypothetical protein DDB_G0276933 [Dictyostelium discoideum AX4]|uniref:Mitochondrial substrate carrier family protein X n=1 Tax=Dictyostelium discoideum TaxID=44689 RepID=MCFX_DICDI|nr:hypothetical protein DDB_G0276933 [Dictyostelium discoideum AX4]Q86AV5.1 RecName: Full=Mitochondrial substrate carrier family protein X [Dictyostelium discoideum]EAL68968.1 hypothetical protein DDB_G0276933 [Dictyostelium discoideum AX4]|eukprot:XP_642825.1 hypothetical protein DDB_G0276933 [Dictyostelium discoideum AX4]